MTTLVLKLFKNSVHGARGGHWSGTGAGPGWVKAVRLLELWATRARTRRELSELDARMLRDIGVTRAQARREAEKPFWHP
ncbi:MAG: DUF1127 domain-containing protein [Gammaproteobacteria bacterium]|nr:DUF1127 domain-containing protein [Gammaproteobacteria bacterium]NIR83545.1 DUF1127 domain-containing protein [Gammaproteobacteria bacterium]NIR91467.1 DUF1127 domain-containing protein [Gammaproteobacteria bacterium]NIU04707.1 DUF1127 domain-containing protein [Gammaproteobacteria bacterium]NIV51749.1 DUF1127 domain-containing protein [Gammaproteobacteria bacterium]